MEEVYTDIDSHIETEENSEKLVTSSRKPKINTISENKSLKFSENFHIADLQQRVIRLEFEFQYLKDKIFEPSRTENQPKLSAYGKLMKKRLANGQH